ncbi:MAG TPA: hypothetical protein VKN63_09820 [Afifellaceae bacterium]|nr:hypothetical protein [Afifellaceae bacterium]
MKNNRAMPVLIVGLLIVVGILSYMLMKEREKSVSIDLPGVKIEAE